MLSTRNQLWHLLLILSITCYSGCGAPPAENPPQQATGSDSEQAEETVGKPAPLSVDTAPAESAPVETEPAVEETPLKEIAETAEVATSETTEPATGTEGSESDEKQPAEPAEEPEESYEGEFVEPPRLPAPEGAQAMPEPNRVWVDLEKKVVLVDGYISLQEGMLEMFACPIGTKEHESIVAVYSSAQMVHTALLAVGAEVGSPVQFNPEFKPSTGTEIAIEVRWQDEAGEWQSIEAQQLIIDIKTEKPMTHPWVFAGSGFFKDEETGEEFYMAEGGELICVSNFSTATLDIPAESSQVNDGLLFAANGKKVPPLWTPVRLVLTPKLENQEK